MVANPEEGRLSPEQQAEALREARKRTTEMKREYRKMRDEADAKARSERWAANHRKSQQEAYDDLADAAARGKLNRQQRRHYAKLMNVFKTPGGWQYFMANFNKRLNKTETVVRQKGKRKEPRTNIEQALASAKVTPKKESN